MFCFCSPDSVRTRNDMYYLLPERSCVPDSPVWFSGAQELPQHQIDKMLQVNLIKNPTISKNLNFPAKKIFVYFGIWTKNVLRKNSQFKSFSPRYSYKQLQWKTHPEKKMVGNLNCFIDTVTVELRVLTRINN